MSTVKLSVSGFKSEFHRDILQGRQHQKLPQLVSDAVKQGMPLEFSFDRPSGMFTYILAYYQSGELHMPTCVCPGMFEKELNFWGIDAEELSQCCYFRYTRFLNDCETQRKFKKETMLTGSTILPMVPIMPKGGVAGFRDKVWKVVDNGSDTLAAKIYFGAVVSMIVISIIGLALSTEPSMRRSVNKCELIEYLEYTDFHEIKFIEVALGNPTCTWDAALSNSEGIKVGDYDWQRLWNEYLDSLNKDEESDEGDDDDSDETVNDMNDHTLDTSNDNIESDISHQNEDSSKGNTTHDTQDHKEDAGNNNTAGDMIDHKEDSSTEDDISGHTGDTSNEATEDDTTDHKDDISDDNIVNDVKDHTEDSSNVTTVDDISDNTGDTVNDKSVHDISDHNEDLRNSTVNKTQSVVPIPRLTVPVYGLDVLEKIAMALFTVDFLVRLFSCPCLKRYFLSFLNIIDACALVSSYIYVIVLSVQKHYRYEKNWVHTLEYLQIFRVFRLFRVVQNVRTTKVLVYSVSKNLRDVSVIALLLLTAVAIFSTVFFFTEEEITVDSIPEAWYWAIVTLTTVGYGDLSPKTYPGRLIASLCAVCGIMILAVTLQIFVNNFLVYYDISCVEEANEARKSKNCVTSGLERDVSMNGLSKTAVAEKDTKVVVLNCKPD